MVIGSFVGAAYNHHCCVSTEKTVIVYGRVKQMLVLGYPRSEIYWFCSIGRSVIHDGSGDDTGNVINWGEDRRRG
jgi:hypothetical protein